MQVDIVKHDGKWAVFPRSAFQYEKYEGDPIFASDEEVDCWDWCDHNRHEFRIRRHVMLVAPEFVKDVERRADAVMRRIQDAGLRVESNVSYRASAAWKEEPAHYAYMGDMGGCAQLCWSDGAEKADDRINNARGWLLTLFGMSDALWELGFTLTFDKDGKHTVYGNYPQWVTLDEES